MRTHDRNRLLPAFNSLTNATGSRLRRAVQAIALFEALKGLAALVALTGLLSLLHHDLHRLALELIGHFGLSPGARYPDILLQGVDRLVGTPARTIMMLGGAYVTLRWIEAWGLWHDRPWGEWFGALSSGVYIPLEIHHILARRHWQGVAVLALNIALMLVLFWRIHERRKEAARRSAAQSNLTRGSTQT